MRSCVGSVLVHVRISLQYTTKNRKMIVFLSTQDAVEFHTRILNRCLLDAARDDADDDDVNDAMTLFQLHGSMTQKVWNLII